MSKKQCCGFGMVFPCGFGMVYPDTTLNLDLVKNTTGIYRSRIQHGSMVLASGYMPEVPVPVP